MTNIEKHNAICKEMNALYERKNRDYGNSFHDICVEEGLAAARIRLSDKLNRFKTLTRNSDKASVSDESIRDTLIDLANYAIMTIMEMDIMNQTVLVVDSVEKVEKFNESQTEVTLSTQPTDNNWIKRRTS